MMYVVTDKCGPELFTCGVVLLNWLYIRYTVCTVYVHQRLNCVNLTALAFVSSGFFGIVVFLNGV